jgi:hypothetical protein
MKQTRTIFSELLIIIYNLQTIHLLKYTHENEQAHVIT